MPKEATTSDSVPQIGDYAAFSRILESGTEVKYYIDIDGESNQLGPCRKPYPPTLRSPFNTESYLKLLIKFSSIFIHQSP
jgi:hypothetical protein